MVMRRACRGLACPSCHLIVPPTPGWKPEPPAHQEEHSRVSRCAHNKLEIGGGLQIDVRRKMERGQMWRRAVGGEKGDYRKGCKSQHEGVCRINDTSLACTPSSCVHFGFNACVQSCIPCALASEAERDGLTQGRTETWHGEMRQKRIRTPGRGDAMTTVALAVRRT